MNIQELAVKYNLDKSGKLHDYGRFYDFYFQSKKSESIKLLEIGIHLGDSLRMWKDFFINKENIVGIDIIDNECLCKCDCHEYKFNYWTKRCKNKCLIKCQHKLVSKCLNNAGIETEIGDASDYMFLNKIKNKYGQFDIIIDDGSHLIDHQKKSFQYLFDILSETGIYVIEDLHTSYFDTNKHPGGGTKTPGTTIEFLKDRIDDVNLHGKIIHLGLQNDFSFLNNFERQIDSITFCKSIVFIVKNSSKISRYENPKN